MLESVPETNQYCEIRVKFFTEVESVSNGFKFNIHTKYMNYRIRQI